MQQRLVDARLLGDFLHPGAGGPPADEHIPGSLENPLLGRGIGAWAGR